MSEQRQSAEAIMGRVGRATLLGVASFLVLGFGLALWLNPDPRGFGTHQQLGLPPCMFRLLFGRPCPGCGMTTCFAYFVRGDFSSAARANLAGVVFAAACALLIPWCLWSAYRGRLWQVSDPIPFVCVLVSCLAGVTGGLWVLRLIAELA